MPGIFCRKRYTRLQSNCDDKACKSSRGLATRRWVVFTGLFGTYGRALLRKTINTTAEQLWWQSLQIFLWAGYSSMSSLYRALLHIWQGSFADVTELFSRNWYTRLQSNCDDKACKSFCGLAARRCVVFIGLFCRYGRALSQKWQGSCAENDKHDCRATVMTKPANLVVGWLLVDE